MVKARAGTAPVPRARTPRDSILEAIVVGVRCLPTVMSSRGPADGKKRGKQNLETAQPQRGLSYMYSKKAKVSSSGPVASSWRVQQLLQREGVPSGLVPDRVGMPRFSSSGH